MFRIGEFALIAQVSGRLLRYYDEIGLLSPVFSDPHTGYRYYSADQLPRLNRILVLKELGLSLDQIVRLLDEHASPEDLRGMLILRRAQIAQAVDEELARLQQVESRLRQLDGQAPPPDVVVKTVPAQRHLAMRAVLPGIAAVRRLVSQIATVVPTRVSEAALGPIAILIHAAGFEPEALDFEVGYLLTGKAPQTLPLGEELVLTQHTLPAVERMAAVVHAGAIDDVHASYAALGRYIEQQQWQLVGSGRQVLMRLPDQSGDDAVVELQLPVQLAPAERQRLTVK